MLFPFIQGRTRAAGGWCRWLRFAVAPDAQLAAGEDGGCLAAEDAARLERELAEHRPTLLLFDRRPGPALERLARASGARWGALGYGEDPERALEALGLSGGAAAPPDFGWTAGNAGASVLEPLPFVLFDAECRYRRPASAEPFFAGLDLAPARSRGCAFCVRSESSARALPLPGLAEQLAAVERTCPRGEGRLRVRVVGETALRGIDGLCALPELRAMRPVELLLDGRSDAVIRAAPRVERALERLSGTAHRLSLALVGMESFCSEQLRRYNKGLSPAQNMEAARLLVGWEARFPGAFGFREHGGLSMIVFDPWSRPEEVDLNLSVAELGGLLPALGKLWDSRLRLYPGLPLEARARRDGLLGRQPADPRLRAARANFYDRELPWRFRDPAMETINRVLARFHEPGGDALGRSVRSFLEEAARAGLPPTAAGHLVIAAAQRARGGSPEAALAGARALIALRPAGVGAEEARWLEPSPEALRQARAQVRARPVLKLEPIRPADADAWAGAGLPNARLRRREWGEDAFELFCGGSASQVRKAVELTGLETGSPAGERRRATDALGRLLGYPRCCSRAHARAPAALRDRYFWGHALNRARHEGAAPWELNPAGGAVVHVPCALSCRESLAQARAALAGMPEREAELRDPVLLLWEGSWARLRPEGEPGERFAYRAAAGAAGGPDLDAVLEGDELEVGPETLLVLRRGRPWAPLSGRALLWWHARAFQAELWKGLAGLAAAAGQARAEAPSVVDGAAVRRILAALDEELRARGLPCRARWEEGTVRVDLAGRRVSLFLGPRGSYAGPAFAELPSFAVCLRGEPELGATGERLLRVFLKLLARRDGELAAALRGPARPS